MKLFLDYGSSINHYINLFENKKLFYNIINYITVF